MQTVTSFPLSEETLLRLPRAGADLFATGRSEGKFIVGLFPYGELICNAEATPEHIKDFCFTDDRPTLGYVGYGWGLVRYGIQTAKQSPLPAVHLKKYRAYIIWHTNVRIAELYTDSLVTRRRVMDILQTPAAPDGDVPHFFKITPNMDKDAYCGAVESAIEQIRAGHSYQLNISMEFSCLTPPFSTETWFSRLFNRYPAPYYTFFRTIGATIISTSPELFLKTEKGSVRTEPIKGTVKLHEGDNDARERLRTSGKEDAELSMIVDLMRNDIAINCTAGSVTVPRHKEIMQVDNLLQMYSVVMGELSPDKDCIDLFSDAFPPGSVTGCPKERTLRIIESLEPHHRNVYCGSFLVVESPRSMTASVAIRTAIIPDEGAVKIYAGSGITVQSKPEDEYHETVAKAEKFLVK